MGLAESYLSLAESLLKIGGILIEFGGIISQHNNWKHKTIAPRQKNS